MSVILTASKKSPFATKPKSAKKKKKRAVATFPAGPPVSTEKTAVWHFVLYGVECTVMFNKEEATVWCNGDDLETVDGYSQTGMNGSVIDFYITLDDNYSHRGRIQMAKDCKTKHVLIVDGCTMEERMHPNQYVHTIQAAQECQQQDQSDYAGYNGAGTYDGGFQDQAGYNQAPGYNAAAYSMGQQGYNGAGNSSMDNGAYGGYSGPPSAAVYEPPPQYEDVVQQRIQ